MIRSLLLNEEINQINQCESQKNDCCRTNQDSENMDDEVQYAELVIAWNVKMLLTAQDKSQSALASFLGIQRPTMTNKMKGRIAWSVADLVKSADFLGTTTEALMDDSLMKQLQGMGNRKATGDTPMASGEPCGWA